MPTRRVLAHHAEGASDAQAVLRHAPEAARRSSALGAHREAAAQFERALRYADSSDPPGLAPLYEGVAAEYALLDRWPETESALRTALRVPARAEATPLTRAGTCTLSTALWRLCRGPEPSRRPGGGQRPAVAAAWPGTSVGLRQARCRHPGLGTTGRGLDASSPGARTSASSWTSRDVVSFALNAIGLTQVENGQDGIADDQAGAEDRAGRRHQEEAAAAYGSLQDGGICLHRFEEAERYYAAGHGILRGRELARVQHRCLRGGQARHAAADRPLGRGRGDLRPRCSPSRHSRRSNQMYPLRFSAVSAAAAASRTPGTCWTRPRAHGGDGRAVWIAQVRAVRAELRCLAGQPDLAAQEAGPLGASGPRRSVAGLVARHLAGPAAPGAGIQAPLARARMRWRSPATGEPPAPGSGSAGRTTRPWSGWARPTKPDSGSPRTLGALGAQATAAPRQDADEGSSA